MNQVQYERWKDFAFRMARNGFHGITEARIGRLVSEIKWFFECCVDDEIKFGGCKIEDLKDWDGHWAGMCFCDHFTNYFEEHDHQWKDGELNESRSANRFLTQLHCCIRAGLDMASAPSGGVVGFTKGNVERMYPEGVPEWIRNNGEDWKAGWGDDAPSVSWEDIPSDQSLWL